MTKYAPQGQQAAVAAGPTSSSGPQSSRGVDTQGPMRTNLSSLMVLLLAQLLQAPAVSHGESLTSLRNAQPTYLPFILCAQIFVACTRTQQPFAICILFIPIETHALLGMCFFRKSTQRRIRGCGRKLTNDHKPRV